jgi:hypothetical protein
VSPDAIGLEVFDRWVTLELSDRSIGIFGFHWELFEDVLGALEDRQARREAQKTVTIDGERVEVDGISDDEADLAAEEAGELMREAIVSVIEDEDLIATGAFLEDISSAIVSVEVL